MEIFAKTDKGNIRVINQDYIKFEKKDEHEAMVVLCDGMGGHNAGEIASQVTCEDIIEHYKNHGEFYNDDEIQVWMKNLIIHAHEKVKAMSLQSSEYEGMGTTVVMAYIKDNDVYISHIGDSRAYLENGDELLQLTKDDSFVNVLVDSGTISQEDASHHPKKNILLQAIGVGDVLKVSFCKVQLDHHILMLCSDGLYNSLYDSQMISILHEHISQEEKVNQLINYANIYGGTDNIGLVLISKERIMKNGAN